MLLVHTTLPPGPRMHPPTTHPALPRHPNDPHPTTPNPDEKGSLLALHRSLLPDSPGHHGIREAQNWLGGSSYRPLEADFIPPPPELAPALLDDLMTYLNSAAHAPLIQAALVHA